MSEFRCGNCTTSTHQCELCETRQTLAAANALIGEAADEMKRLQDRISELEPNADAFVHLRFAYQEMTRQRIAVIDWMAAEGAAGNLRTNDNAPAWTAYEIATAAFDALLLELAAPVEGGV